MASAVAITPTSAGLAVCYVRVEAEEAQDQTPSAAVPALEDLSFSVDFEFLEDDAPPGASKTKPKVFERMLSSSRLLTPDGNHKLVLESQAFLQYQNASSPPGAFNSRKLDDYDVLMQLLSQKFTAAGSSITHRAARSRSTAIRNLGLELPQSSTPAAAAFGTPEARKAHRQKKRGLRDVVGDFLTSEQCISPDALDIYNAFKADRREKLADALWLAMYDVQEQVKQQRKRKRSRGADPKGVYKANKRPRTTETQQAVATATPPTAADEEDEEVLVISTPPQRGLLSSTAAAAAAPARGRVRRRLVEAIDLTLDD